MQPEVDHGHIGQSGGYGGGRRGGGRGGSYYIRICWGYSASGFGHWRENVLFLIKYTNPLPVTSLVMSLEGGL